VEKASKSLKIDQFKQTRLKQISKSIQSKIFKLQNPSKELCSKVPKLLCRLTIKVGIGSIIHELLWCLLLAYYNNQTVILIPDLKNYYNQTSDPNYNEKESWNKIFIPLSETCSYKDLPRDQLIEIPRPNNVIDRKLANYLPKNIGSELINLLDNPISWFHSQFVGYIMRPQPRLKKYNENFKREIDYGHPIVGVHVRRTDKLDHKEAFLNPLSDYMLHVKDYFDKSELISNVSQRLVYVASDDPSVLPTLKIEYQKYEFIGRTSISGGAICPFNGLSNHSLWGVLSDIHMLSESDYIVCTLSSAVSIL